MADADDKAALKRPQDFFNNPKTSKIMEEAESSISESKKREIIEESRLRNQEDWSYLANKVVGAEGD